VNDYITLATSDYPAAGRSKQFWASELAEKIERNESEEITTGGRLAIIRGRARQTWTLTLLAPDISVDSNWGSRGDLEYFFKLRNPSGSPSDTLTMTYFDETVYQVRFREGMQGDPLGVVMYGSTAYYAYQVELVDVTQPSIDLSKQSYSFYTEVI